MADKRIFILAHEQARRNAVDCVDLAPHGYVVTVSEPTRNLEQNAALHALLGEIADSCEWAGKKWDIDTWKRLMVASWCRATGQQVVMLPALDGAGIDLVFRRTSDLSKRECSELLEFVHCWAAEHMPQRTKPRE